jgi:PKD repeat protein
MVAPVASFTASAVTGRRPLVVQFTDASTNTPTSWAWSFGDGNTSTAQNPVHTFNAPGLYIVSLTATNASGSSSYTLPQGITVTASGPELVIQVGLQDAGGSYLVGTLNAQTKLGAKGTCSFGLFNPTTAPLFGHEVGVWDMSDLTDSFVHGSLTMSASSVVVSNNTSAAGTSGTEAVAFLTTSAGTKQGAVNLSNAIKIWIDTDRHIYVQYVNSNLPSSGVLDTGIVVSNSVIYMVVARWSSAGQYSVRVNGTETNAGTGVTFGTSTSRVGLGQLGNTAGATTSPLLGKFIEQTHVRAYITDEEVARIEAWIPFPFKDSRAGAACWDCRYGNYMAYVPINAAYAPDASVIYDNLQLYRVNVANITWSTITVTGAARKLFGGRVLSTEQRDRGLSPNVWYTITADDFSSTLRRRIQNVNFSSSISILNAILTLCGERRHDMISVNNVNNDDGALSTTISSKDYGYKRYDEILADLLKLVSRSFYVDARRDLHVYSSATVNCPISLFDGSNNYRNLVVSRDGTSYANNEYLVTGFMSDIVSVPDASTADYTISAVTNYLEYGYFSAAFNAQKAIEIVGTGGYDMSAKDEAIVAELLAQQRIIADWRRFGQVAETLSLETDCRAVEVGQVLSAVLAAHSVSGSYLITSMTLVDKGGAMLRRTIRAIKGTYQHQWIDWFANLGKA